MDEKKRVLFVSTANAARSPMAEVLMRHHGGNKFEIHSAGLRPQAIDPRALQTLRQSGFGDDDVSSKSIMDFADQSFDYVIALNDLTPKELGMLPSARECFVWHFRDPQIEE